LRWNKCPVCGGTCVQFRRNTHIDGVAATSRAIRSGDYPLARPLSLVTKGNPAGLAKLFIEYAASSQVSDLVIAHDFVPYLD
jgi:phosphate transport system substrate-binding protein